ncbi:MAG: hypothetical protein P1T08_09960 [Acidimicrobiia bacterium]|nr:hypothetical protein [Acidimicrobiia bacterium]
MSEETRAAVALGELAMQLRRHYYHRPYEQAPDDLIEEGIIGNLEWDERDGLWVQIDATITLEVPPTGSPLGIYAEEGPVVSLWRSVGAAGIDWSADWDVGLTAIDQQAFLGKLADTAVRMAAGVQGFVQQFLVASAELEEDERQETGDVAREWLAGA